MIQIYEAENRYQVNAGWLQSRLSFSFGEFYDPNNTEFGVMRVCNDDVVAPGRGFGAHPHSDMEIVTIVLEGAVQHSDNLGNSEITSAGEVQRMSAGTGIVHAEFNASKTESTRFLQLWFEPRELGLFPTYETRRYDAEQLRNALLPVVTPEGSEQAVMINQDLTLYLSRLDQGRTLSFEQKEGRRMFMFAIEGQITVSGKQLRAGDTARIESESNLVVEAEKDAFFMLIDLP
ncbi:pirin family protein [Paenibacillus chondroitinus]|uniref:Pirin family protein n=1 Tax=Paenibacillus chondroitinus TaxID=59842 RepID=A0ABU6DBY9_9BACL|nr:MULTISPECIES: pirin family protein [Paenibacillus]MCY9656753.1 pirin family protein [Paenibacillus anseongense]MEB4794402.1 pirin family protein [Paenibacillus chondroitinus]